MFCSLRCGFCSRNLKIMVGEIKLRLLCPTEASGRQAQGGAMCPVPGAWTPLPPPPTWLQPRISTEGGRGGRRGTWSFWCLLAWFPALPATAPGSVNALEEIVPRVCLGAAQRLALDRHSLPPACPESPAAGQALSSRSWTSVVKGPGGMAPGGPVIP